MDEQFAPRAEVLYDSVGYVRGWAQARAAAEELAVELRALGLEGAFAYLTADVNVFGKGVVRLEQVTAQDARRFVQLLTRGLCAELEQLATTEDTPNRPSPAA